jgi:hypothetical protein
VPPHTAQAGQNVLVLRQLYLRFGLRCFGPPGKNVQDQVGAVDGFYTRSFSILEICEPLSSSSKMSMSISLSFT